VAQTTVFGDILPSQQAAIIEELKKRGEYVAMVGNDASDVPAMRAAKMGIALKNSAQAALAHTDIILLANSMRALPLVVTTGQRMVNSVLDTLKLNLSQVGMILVMVILMWLFKFDHFPIYSAQIGVVGLFAVIIPNIILSAWSTAGRLTAKDLWDRLIRFIVPAGVTMGILAIVVFKIFWSYLPLAHFPPEVLRNLQVADSQLFYAQLGVTWALLFAGWLLIFFLLPPTPFWSGGAPLRGDKRVFGMVAFSVMAFLTVPLVPFFSKSLYVTWLPNVTDYLMVAVMVFIWMIGLKAVWRLNLTAPLSNLLVKMMPGTKRKATNQQAEMKD
jgi:cation-transporting ATPase E